MAASDMLSQLQFSYKNEGGFNKVQASHPEHGPVGYIHWAAPDVDDGYMVDPGEVKNIAVGEKFQRKGVATALWNHAKGLDPTIKHSTTQSPDGIGWASAVGA